MKCLYCKSENTGKFCQDCGKELLVGFSVDNFSDVLDFVREKQDVYLSQKFRELVESKSLLPTPHEISRDFKRMGYLFRACEERFGEEEGLDDIEFRKIMNNSNKNDKDKIIEAVDYLDSSSNKISLDGVPLKYFIYKDIAPVFTDYVMKNIKSVINSAKKGQLLIKIDDPESLTEILFRNAVWGYWYRLVENNLNKSKA